MGSMPLLPFWMWMNAVSCSGRAAPGSLGSLRTAWVDLYQGQSLGTYWQACLASAPFPQITSAPGSAMLSAGMAPTQEAGLCFSSEVCRELLLIPHLCCSAQPEK